MMTTRLQRRREPSQARGHERVRTLLEATGQLLEDVGYDALTTKAIAERARDPAAVGGGGDAVDVEAVGEFTAELGAIAAGLLCYGLFQLLHARYARL
jgi:hypothetical protein